MDPNIDRYNGFDLPQPIGETGNPAPEAGTLSTRPNTPEVPASREQMLPTANMSMPAPTANPMAVPDNQAQSSIPASADPRATIVDTPAVANDSDRIEKEWVDKAKQIVEKTRQDPYQQNRQLTSAKVDYIQKRYGKTLKLSE